MTDVETDVMIAGVIIWLLIGISTTYFMLTSKEREDVQVREYLSPGAVCVMFLSRDQRQRIVRWILEEENAPKPLQSFSRQLLKATPANGVTVYRGQVKSVSEMLERRGWAEVAKEIRGE